MKGPSKRRFQQIFDEGFRVSGRFSRVISLSGKGLIGFATSKAIGSRPQRNRARRRVRSALMGLGPCIPTGLDLVIQVNVEGAGAEFQALVEDLRSSLVKTSNRWASDSASS